ncbi:DNA/RNA non-specific endonuclease [Enterococcus plantarum]|uniref:DNA/RNA non-specific endonuclease n=1 Tax=Enterococcus plantarum TaxID=1077675 RepID=UPI003BF48AD1
MSLDNGVWQIFSDLDSLNRVGVANALIGKESFPHETIEPLSIKPTGWNQKKLSDSQWLYNRCHLVGYQLTGENNNMKNLMTGTRSFNTPHMLNYENQIMDYIRLTGNHVRYRVTPHFIGDELVARGVQMEATSVESNDFAYNVYIFNIQEGYTIDYTTGKATKN